MTRSDRLKLDHKYARRIVILQKLDYRGRSKFFILHKGSYMGIGAFPKYSMEDVPKYSRVRYTLSAAETVAFKLIKNYEKIFMS